MVHFASPSLDLHYNIFLSTDKQLRDAHYDDLLRLYYDQLSTNIRRMGSDPDALYSYDNFLEGLKACGNFAYLPIPNMLLLSIVRADELGDIKNFTESTESSAVQNLSPASELEYKTRLTDIVNDLERLGYFREIQINPK